MFLEGDESRISMGMDSGWFFTFLDAFFDSFSATELPIWRVFTGDFPGSANYKPISAEGSWDSAWQQIEALRKADPHGRYVCDTSFRSSQAEP